MQKSTKAEWPETKRKLVDASVKLMRARGFNGTSLDNICAAAQVTKGGFFHYFKSKEEIAKVALAQFSAAKAKVFQDAPFRSLADPLDRVFGYVDFIIESLSAAPLTKGCLIGMIAQELSATNPELRDACQESFLRTRRDFENDLAEAKALYCPRAAFSPQSVSKLFAAIIQGSLILAKAERSNGAIIENLRHFRHYLEDIFHNEQ